MEKVFHFDSPPQPYVADAAVLCCFDQRIRLAVYKFLQKQDEELGQIFNDYRRSTAFFQIAMMYDRNLLTEEEFQEFSPETVNMILGLRNGFGN